MTKTFRACAAALGFALACLSAGCCAMAHPLDPLSADEITVAVDTLRAAGLADADTRFSLIDLDEPAKASVLAWQPGQSLGRAAFVVARRARKVYEGVVDLDGRRVTRWQTVPGVQPSILEEEWEAAQRITIDDPGWQAAMRKRGYTSFDQLFCAPFPAAYFARAEEADRRLLRVVCFDRSGGASNVWARPIEGLQTVVDLDERRVIQLVDSGPVPVSRDPADFKGAAAVLRSPGPHGFSLSGNEVRWHNWSFLFRMDRRVGPIVSLIRYRDHNRERLILYRGSLSEMFVPYMDPSIGWAFRTPMDVGEYGFGLLASPLAAGIDCPADAAFIDVTLPDDEGAPVLARSRMCLFERDAEGPLWRHAEFVNQSYAGRPAVELVLRTIAAIGNYDYVLDWVLTDAGVIRVDVGATGIDEVKGVATRAMGDATAARDTAYGTLVAPNLVAVNHDHFLSFRLDVDVDGSQNTLVRQRLLPRCLERDSARRSLWQAVDEDMTVAGPVEGALHGGDEVLRIVNPGLITPLGQHPGYELRLDHSVTSLLAADDFPQRRAAFAGAPLWVTAYDPAELYAAGAYPNQSKGDDGLPAYVGRHRSVANTDIVLWPTMGFHHVPRPEDWPVLPTMWHSLSLVPDGFFDRDPAVDAMPTDAPR